MTDTIDAFLARGGTITKYPPMPARGLMEIERITGVTVSYIPAPPNCTVTKADEARARSRAKAIAKTKAKAEETYKAIKACRLHGMNTRQIMAYLGVGETTVKRHSRRMHDEAKK